MLKFARRLPMMSELSTKRVNHARNTTRARLVAPHSSIAHFARAVVDFERGY